MPLTTSIQFDEKDIYVAYGLSVLAIDNLGTPDIPNNAAGRLTIPGSSRGIAEPQSKVLKLSGEIVATSHANLLTYIDNLKKAIYQGHHGLHKFRLTLTDSSDRYYQAWCADIKVEIPHPRYTQIFAGIEITLVIDDPFGIYNTFTFINLTGSPFSSPFSCGYNYQGTAVSRPRVLCHNDGASNITSLEILNLAAREREKIVAVTTAGLKRATGRWGDVKGAIFFDGAGSSYFTTKGNFNPGCFSVFGFVYWVVGAEGSPGYLFSTTGNTIRCYYNVSPAKWIFEIDGNAVEITDASSGFTHSEWWAIGCSYNGDEMVLTMLKVGEDAATRSLSTDTGITYTGIPTNTYIGTDASLANYGDKYLDDLRFYNYRFIYAATPSGGYLLPELEAMTAPLPMGKCCTAYFPFDYQANGIGWQNTDLLISGDTMAQYEMYEINCAEMNVKTFAAAVTAAPSNIMSKVSGEFPFLIPGYNALQIIHDGSASGLSMAIEDKRRFL